MNAKIASDEGSDTLTELSISNDECPKSRFPLVLMNMLETSDSSNLNNNTQGLFFCIANKKVVLTTFFHPYKLLKNKWLTVTLRINISHLVLMM